MHKEPGNIHYVGRAGIKCYQCESVHAICTVGTECCMDMASFRCVRTRFISCEASVCVTVLKTWQLVICSNFLWSEKITLLCSTNFQPLCTLTVSFLFLLYISKLQSLWGHGIKGGVHLSVSTAVSNTFEVCFKWLKIHLKQVMSKQWYNFLW